MPGSDNADEKCDERGAGDADDRQRDGRVRLAAQADGARRHAKHHHEHERRKQSDHAQRNLKARQEPSRECPSGDPHQWVNW